MPAVLEASGATSAEAEAAKATMAMVSEGGEAELNTAEQRAAADWSDSGDNSNSQEEAEPAVGLGPGQGTQGPSLSYERKIRLHKYAENRARSCLGLLSETSNVLWRLHDSKGDVGVYKPSSDWSEFVSAKAVTRANAAFPNVLKTVYDLRTSDKFKLFMRKVLGDMFLDAEVLEDLNGTGIYPSANPPRDAREVYKQAAIKWWAIKSGTLASKSTDFYVLEVSVFAGNEAGGFLDANTINCSTLASKRLAGRLLHAICFRSLWQRSGECRISRSTTSRDRSSMR